MQVVPSQAEQIRIRQISPLQKRIQVRTQNFRRGNPGENLGGKTAEHLQTSRKWKKGGAAGLGSGDKEEPDGSLSQWEDVTDVPEPYIRNL